jgi:peptidyl-prolyl cis-trans isomerase SurA
MNWRTQWYGIGVLGLSGCLLVGCASLPEWAQPDESLDYALSDPVVPRVERAQMPEGRPVTLQQPVPPPTSIAPPVAIGPPPGVTQTSLSSRGTVRVSVRAWVNGRPIFEDEIMQMAGQDIRRIQTTLPEPQRSQQLSELMNVVLEGIIDQELMYQDAVKRLEKVNPTGLEKLKEYVDQEFDKSLDKMRRANMPEADIREIEPVARRLLARNLISGEYARTRIRPIVESRVGLSEIREYYEEHKNEFQTLDKVTWQDIFIPLNPNQPTINDLVRFAEEQIRKCRPGTDDFNKLMVYNEGDSKLRNGEGLGSRLSYRDAAGKLIDGDIRPMELAQPLASLREGEIGPVIPFSTGVHLIRVTKREYAGQIPLNDETQKTIRKKLEGQLFEREYRRIVRELKTRAVVRMERDS